MKGWSLKKLEAIAQTLTAKEAALLVIEYYEQEEQDGTDYATQIRTIASSLPNAQKGEYNLLLSMYQLLCLLYLDFQTTYVRLHLSLAKLEKLQYMLMVSAIAQQIKDVLVQLSVPYPEGSLEQGVLQTQKSFAVSLTGLLQICTPKHTALTVSAEVEPVLLSVLKQATVLRQKLLGYAQAFADIEQTYFAGRQLVSCSDALDETEALLNAHNQTLAQTSTYFNGLTQAYSFPKAKEYQFADTIVPDPAFVTEIYTFIVRQAERQNKSVRYGR